MFVAAHLSLEVVDWLGRSLDWLRYGVNQSQRGQRNEETLK